ncbi:hypothetical protein GCM10022254_21770 [Actinomadura meridiana]|uniref:HTH merR-type domain-containing protein n=1 Tax=Actinomadura meridiana TaxID=559626 RepID=A0ABP8BX89_9ACTN
MQSPEVKPLRWGWISALYFESGMGWMDPTEAAKLSGVRTTNLRSWSEKGMLSVIHFPRQPRRYYIPELRYLARLGEMSGEPLTLTLLNNQIDITLELGHCPKFINSHGQLL